MKIKQENIFVIFVSFSLFGYSFIGSISSFIYGQEGEATLTILYRLTLFSFALYFSFVNFTILGNNVTKKVFYVLLLFIMFWLLYSLRITYDFIFQPEVFSDGLFYSYYVLGIFVTLTSCFAIWTNINKSSLVSILKFSFWLLFLTAILMLILGISRYGDIDYQSSRLSISRLNAISAGRSFSVLLIIAIFLKELGYLKFCLLFVVSLISLTGMFLSGSRGVMLGMFLVMTIYSAWRLSFVKTLIAIFLLVIVYNFVHYLQVYQFGYSEFDLLKGLSSAGSTSDQSAQIRYKLYSGAWAQFMDSPFLGDATTERIYQYSPHNFILELLMSLGVVGLVIFVMYFSSIVVSLIIAIKKSAGVHNITYSCLLFLMLFFVIGSLFSSSIVTSTELWMISLLSLLSISGELLEKKVKYE